MVGAWIYRHWILNHQFQRIEIHVRLNRVDCIQSASEWFRQPKGNIDGGANCVGRCKFGNKVHLNGTAVSQWLSRANPVHASIGYRTAVGICTCFGGYASARRSAKKILGAGILRTAINRFSGLWNTKPGTRVANVNRTDIWLRTVNWGAGIAGSQNLIACLNAIAGVAIIAMRTYKAVNANIHIGIAKLAHGAI